jgi:riboflavin synthase
MFTGIIQAVGRVKSLEKRGGDVRISLATDKLPLADVALGDSIAVSGICLTVIGLPGDGFDADVSSETLSRTILGDLSPGDRVNLEKALTLSTPLGGHLVSGHVDGNGKVVNRAEDARSIRFDIEAPAEIAHYIAEKGSICVDGISLTVNKIDGCVFSLNIVPHTVAETTMNEYKVGRQVNLEVDLIARYLERLLLGSKAAEPGESEGISLEFLSKNGFRI